VDAFVFSELKEKNARLSEVGVGFHFMDRAPLDLYAFSRNEEERKKKTQKMKEIVTRDKPLQQGEILFITAAGKTLVERNIGRGRLPSESGTAEYFRAQNQMLEAMYNPQQIWKTDDRFAADIAKQIARHVLLGDYRPKDLMPIMERFA